MQTCKNYARPQVRSNFKDLQRHDIIPCRVNEEVIAGGQAGDLDGGLRRPCGKRDSAPCPAVYTHYPEESVSVGSRIEAFNRGIAGDQSRVNVDSVFVG